MVAAVGTRVWLTFQSASDRDVVAHLTVAEQREFRNRMGLVTTWAVSTILAPLVLAFVLYSPTGVCVAATVAASNLFVRDWFNNRHRKWLDSTVWAREHRGE